MLFVCIVVVCHHVFCCFAGFRPVLPFGIRWCASGISVLNRTTYLLVRPLSGTRDYDYHIFCVHHNLLVENTALCMMPAHADLFSMAVSVGVCGWGTINDDFYGDADDDALPAYDKP